MILRYLMIYSCSLLKFQYIHSFKYTKILILNYSFTDPNYRQLSQVLWIPRILILAINILCVNCVTVANGKRPPSQDLQSSDTHGHQANQVEHGSVEALQGTKNKDKQSVGVVTFIYSWIILTVTMLIRETAKACLCMLTVTRLNGVKRNQWTYKTIKI